MTESLEEGADSEILVADEDGMLFDFTVEKTDAVFDGFDMYYPEGLKIVLNRDE